MAVKQSIGRFAAESLFLAEAHRLIEEAAARTLAAPRKPVRFDLPARIVLTFNHSGRADMAALLPGSERLGGLRVAYTAGDAQTLIRAWQAMIALAGTAG